jgi:hypothetical protein
MATTGRNISYKSILGIEEPEGSWKIIAFVVRYLDLYRRLSGTKIIFQDIVLLGPVF